MDKKTIHRYSNEYLRHYSQQGMLSVERFLIDIRKKKILNVLSKYQPKSILEIGCGLEPLYTYWNKYNLLTIIEPSEEFVEILLPNIPFNTTIYNDYFESAVIDNCNYDVIVAASILHEVDNPDIFLQKLYTTSGLNSIIHLSVPNVNSLHRLIALEMGLIQSVFEESAMERRFQRKTRFDKKTFIDMVESHGFIVEKFETYFIKPFTHEQIEQGINREIFPQEILTGFENLVKYLPDFGAEMCVEMRKAT